MRSLFDGTVSAALRGMLGVDVRDFQAEDVSNRGGFVPHYVHGGAAGCEWRQQGRACLVPPRALVFVAEERSEIHHGVTEQEAEALLRLGASFTAEITLPAAALRPVVEDYLAMCRTLGLEPKLKPRGEQVQYTAPRAEISAQVLARMRPL